jgi:hypothetical protein
MRRPVLAALAGLMSVTSFMHLAGTAAADDGSDRKELPGTNLEADERDDGTTDTPAWMIGSGIAAVMAVGVGGTLLGRRSRAEA